MTSSTTFGFDFERIRYVSFPCKTHAYRHQFKHNICKLKVTDLVDEVDPSEDVPDADDHAQLPVGPEQL